MSQAANKLIQAAAGAGVDTGDDDFANVVLLLDGDGTSGDDNNTFTDSSTNGLTITESGSVIQGSFSPYGDNWSNYFASGQNLLKFPDSADFDLGTTWTVEAWIFPNAANSSKIFGTRNGSGNMWELLIYASDKKFAFEGYGANNTSGPQKSSSTFEPGQWYHVAVVTSSGATKLYVDGVLEINYSNSLTWSTAYGPWIGGTSAFSEYSFDGYVSNLRVVKGTAVYTGAFTPPTEPLTAITNTVLLTCQANRFVDNSTSAHTITITGTPKVNPFSPFKNDDARDITTDVGSAYLNDDAYTALSAGDGNILPATDDFTIEGWVYHTGLNLTSSNRSGFFIKDKGSNRDVNDGVFRSHFNNNGTTINSFNAVLFIDGANQGYNTDWPYTFNLFEWYHVALVRYGSTVELFINGESQGTGTGVTTLEQNTDRTNYIASWRSDKRDELVGYISDFRIVSSRVYTTDFTPPTSPLTAITNTELLLSFQDAGIYDRAGLNNIDTVGNAQIDTAVKKYGTGSLEFDGTGDRLVIPDPLAFDLGSSDFTLECWFNARNLDASSNYGLISSYSSTTDFWTLRIQNTFNWGIQFRVYEGSDLVRIEQGSDFTTNNTWVHVAVTREGNTFRLFKDGTLVTSATYSGSVSQKTTNVIGEASAALDQTMDGFMDDVRITKGIARYTANFTPPSAALPKF